MSDVLPHEVVPLTVTGRMTARLGVGVGRLLAKAPPAVLRGVLGAAARGARAATYCEARRARDTVLTADAFSRGGSACLSRSIATALICRTRGAWPDWCVGVLSTPPFTAHAWVEAEVRIVDEPMNRADFSTLFVVSVSSAPSAEPTLVAA